MALLKFNKKKLLEIFLLSQNNMMIVHDIKIIEAILFASKEPVSELDLKEKIANKKKFND